MLRLLLLFLLSGCFSHTSENIAKNKQIQTENWLEIYNYEIKIAIKNEDADAFRFFLQEYIQERRRLGKVSSE